MKLKLKLLLIPILFVGLNSCSSNNDDFAEGSMARNIIPEPVSLKIGKDFFPLYEDTKIVYHDQSLEPLARLLMSHIENLTGFDLSLSESSSKQSSSKLRLAININLDNSLKGEEYKINIGKSVVLSAGSYKGLANASASLIQLISIDEDSFYLPYLKLTDNADYAYRAVLVDLARFWHPIETIKETIDLLWFYKIPYLQLHLSDNRRFTFPMEQFPKLKKVLPDGSREYYTKSELNELVEYARVRGVAIVPEIDLPGHSGQLFTQYPEIFGTLDAETGKAKYMHVVNIAKEECYTAVEDIINELVEVFYTSPYIHLGGDEVYLEELKKVPEYKGYCEKHGLDEALEGNAQELFCHFINQMHEMVKAAGKKTIIWEGFHGEGAGKVVIDKDIDVIVWNTTYNHPDTLLAKGYSIINSTWMPWYYVGAMNFAPSTERAYEWDLTEWAHWNENIADVSLESKTGIKGGQISFWEQNYYMVIPILRERLPFLAEKLWNNDSSSDYEGFMEKFSRADTRYSQLFEPIVISSKNLINNEDFTFSDYSEISLNKMGSGKLRYSFNESWGIPDSKVMKDYNEVIRIENSGILSAQVLDENGNAIGYPVQRYFQKIEPGYEYKAYGPAPVTGWDEMPDFEKLPVIRSGLMGKMNDQRLEKINGELFAKVKAAGHIDTRMNGVYNPYALDLKGSIKIEKSADYTFVLQTHDGLAELYIDDELVAKGTEFGNKAEEFNISLQQGEHKIRIKYFYKHIQNQLSIMYKTKGDSELQPFEDLVETIM